MQWIVNLLSDIGSGGIHLFWLPIGIWTIVALAGAGLLKLCEDKISAVYHYHSRVALLWGLAAGVIGTVGLSLFPLQSAGTNSMGIKFIVIQSPISVTAAAPAASVNWGDPALWIGLLTTLTLLAGILASIKVIIDFFLLKSFSRRLSYDRSVKSTELSAVNKQLLKKYNNSIQILFSNDVDVPCTFGLREKYVVLPRHLQHDTGKLNMALRHELAHIHNNDYLINASVQTVKAIFFFHPLVHSLAAGIEEYREIYCDQHVIREADISRKRYAKLLVELSPKPVFKSTAAVNMAVRPSTLKKRIKTMTTSKPIFPSFKASLGLMLISALIITGLMACSDIEEGGITQSEIEDKQVQIDSDIQLNDQAPLYIINGEEVDPDANVIARLKPKYIEQINVLKGKKARQKYGSKGKNGVIKIKLINKEKALSDLRTDKEMEAMRAQKTDAKTDDREEIFIAVEDPPQLKGGLQELQKHVEYPQSCREAGIEGRVTLQFVVNKQGEAENVEVLDGIGGGCDEAAVKAVKKYAKFEPGMQRGMPVQVQYSLPLIFKLAGNGDRAKGSVSSEDMSMQAQKMEIRNLRLSRDGTLTGKVYDKNSNKPIAGTNIVVKGTNQGTASRPDGTFKIENIKDENGKLRISYMGYTPLLVSYD